VLVACGPVMVRGGLKMLPPWRPAAPVSWWM